MLAYHNDPAIKAKYLARVKAHRKADALVKGQYWENGKGCAVGCTIEAGDHARYETELGIPQTLARLEDVIFEGLPNDLAQEWPERFLSAINVGADLSLVQWKFLHWLQVKNYHNAVEKKMPQYVIDAIGSVVDLLTDIVAGVPINKSATWSAMSAAESAMSAARSAARAAGSAESAVWSSADSVESAARATWSAAASAAESSAESSAESAASATWSARRAAESATRSAADSAAYVSMSDKLIELLEAA